MANDDDDIIREFIEESNEGLDRLDRDLVALEEEPESTGRIAGIFRTIHTIKGTSGLLGFSKLEAITHVGENVLAKLRDGKLSLTPETISALLAMVDAVRKIVESINASGAEGELAFESVTEALSNVLTPPAPEELRKVASSAQKAEAAAAPASPSIEAPLADTPVTTAAKQQPPAAPTPEIVATSGLANGPTEPESVTAERATTTTAADDLVQTPPANAHQVAPTESAKSPPQRTRSAEAIDPADASVRVGVSLLDKLMNLVGELVLVRNQIIQYATEVDDAVLSATSQRLSLITTELQEGIMKTRMQPIGGVWSKFPRVVRDLAVACGKQVRLEMEGRETELDRTILEAIRDPLTHIVRNSVDHGLETPDERKRAGKQETGVVLFRAFHEGGLVNIEITDDGRGIDPQKIKAKAVEKGVISAERAARLSDRDAAALVFLPGFSTAERVTNVSGRGVGMDVVKTSIEKIGGTVDIQSRLGFGTSIRVKIPLTLAIIPALIVSCGANRFAIPQVNLVELVKLEGEAAVSGVERLRDTPVFRLRGRLLPLVYLRSVLGLPEQSKHMADGISIVVLQADEHHIGLVVDRVHDTQEIVVKPIGRELKGIPAYAGATIMGDGHVALILDVFGIATQLTASTEAEDAMDQGADATALHEAALKRLLVFEHGDGHLAVSLDRVDRLEELPVDKIERAGNSEVTQYRGDIMKLVRVSDFLGDPSRSIQDTLLSVFVCTHAGHPVGVVVDRIVDVVEEHLDLKNGLRRPGITGAAVVRGRVTELLDLDSMLLSEGHQPSFQDSTEVS